jgi:hypothetical protein
MENDDMQWGEAIYAKNSHLEKGRMDSNQPYTISVPEAGRRYFGLSRNASYAAAARGEIPTIQVGRLRRVPVRAMERKLDQAGEKLAAAPR